MSTKGTFYMGRKAKFSKEIKIKACEKYRKGKGSFKSISEEIGCGKAVFYKWYHRRNNLSIKIRPSVADSLKMLLFADIFNEIHKLIK